MSLHVPTLEESTPIREDNLTTIMIAEKIRSDAQYARVGRLVLRRQEPGLQ